MTVYSLFHSVSSSSFRDDVDDPIASSVSVGTAASERYNVLFYKEDEIVLDESEEVEILPAGYSGTAPTDQVILFARVVGHVEVHTEATDYDDVSSIDGYQRASGNDIFPGQLILSSYNIQTWTFKGLQDGTRIHYLMAVVCADDDVRYEDYA